MLAVMLLGLFMNALEQLQSPVITEATGRSQNQMLAAPASLSTNPSFSRSLADVGIDKADLDLHLLRIVHPAVIALIGTLHNALGQASFPATVHRPSRRHSTPH